MSVEELRVVEMAWVLANRHPLQPPFKWEEAESLGGALMANAGGHLQSLLSSSSLHPSVEARLARALPQHPNGGIPASWKWLLSSYGGWRQQLSSPL